VSDQVIAVTRHGAVLFRSLEEALDSKLIEYSDFIYDGERQFCMSCRYRDGLILAERLQIQVPEGWDKGGEGTRHALWSSLLSLSVSPGALEEQQRAIQQAAGSAAPRTLRTGLKTMKQRTGKRGTRVKYGDDYIITVLAPENPKQGTAAPRFALYRTGMTVSEYMALGGLRTDVNWDSRPQNSWIKVTAPEAAPLPLTESPVVATEVAPSPAV
jgi:hypothetical protein